MRMPLRMYQETSILEASKGYALSCRMQTVNLMHVGGTAFLYIIHTNGGGLFFIIFVNVWKINNAKSNT